MARKIKQDDQPIYKRFDQTFPICTMGLAIAFIYPNPVNRTRRIIYYILQISSMAPGVCVMNIYIATCMETGDIESLTRQIMVDLVLIIFMFKTSIAIVHEKKFRTILEVISNDYLKANHMDETYQNIYNEYIAIGKVCQKGLLFIAIVLATLYPIFSGFATMISYLFQEDNEKYMVHPLKVKNFEDKQFETPYYELIWIYQTYICSFMSPSFAGFDAAFGICCAHASLKLRLVSHKLERIFETADSVDDLKLKLNEVIVDHQNAYKFYELLQEMFGDWLFVVYLLSSSIISLNLYQLSVNKGMHPQFLIFFLCAIVHMYVPCHFASILDKTGLDMPLEIYKCAWQNWSSPEITNMIRFMIAYAQTPLALKARGLVTFNMELFVSIMQASYSFYTLIRP